MICHCDLHPLQTYADMGRQYDGHGNLKDWWTKEDGEKFTPKAQCIADEYARFSVEDIKLNGKLTLGENTADNGGLRLALMAFLARAGVEHVDLGKKSPDGYTPVQQLFLGSAQNWRSEWRPELERLIATTNPRAPDRFRANGVLVNMPEFGTGVRLQGWPAHVPSEDVPGVVEIMARFRVRENISARRCHSGREDPPKFNRSMLGGCRNSHRYGRTSSLRCDSIAIWSVT